ncbi:hypothetical protein A3D66_00940 [Candidatus Kaiserbacteria bacterium RIFCSPHIGHO2_02_FULL_50_9]|uniref:50S ribosomal protein L13 n=1 Tax=Candidatus Kaiserbacteria bacterium RIFCSPLOWO2_01_FULL_51_21 TaxID=1798508 RepID=A0A1F6EDP5_9BACT|nr:MAG: hypothetical protein A2761_00730 [Candidatus Kaiserbacteria bacterium RIFCSPHIGHO2_01_FULL_51_33]OGG63687.1 MAG: hypothetical protein A3D66_00940 [Candidatus Kaiserbacteria bacterium RIFCSPHIGHO2_02_FULL_50_9]OGG71776.1 MAG: hypothetical protein A3A35_02550 [Candidatus Kaiserbacteria bacterium RIFCSPLOWO2_01_FULL_51_21]
MRLYTINAQGRSLGRVASEAARVLRGKDTPLYRRDRIPEVMVRIENAGKLRIDPRKLRGKTYSRYSGYPGGLRFETLESLQSRRGAPEVLRRAVFGMLPKNNSRAKLMKQLTITL